MEFTSTELAIIFDSVEFMFHQNVDWHGNAWDEEKAAVQRAILAKVSTALKGK